MTDIPDNINFDFAKISDELHVREEIMKKLVTSFSNTYREKLKQLEEGVANQDITKMRAILHEVKGTAGNLRLNIIYQIADEMHQEVKGEAVREKLAAYMTRLKQLSETLDKYLREG